RIRHTRSKRDWSSDVCSSDLRGLLRQAGAVTAFGRPLAITPTAISGLLLVDLTVHGDNRGWFKENWQREAMTAAGLPDFGPVQRSEERRVGKGERTLGWSRGS